MLELVNRFGFIQHGEERRRAKSYFDRLQVKTPSVDTRVVALSGGNQQKVALAKWLGRDCRILLLDEPTRGVDVGAKATIHQLIDELAGEGYTIVLISSELPEVIKLSTRVLVMHEGTLVGEFDRLEATQERVLHAMAGVSPAAAWQHSAAARMASALHP
jgi:ABC-type sugar transport system ATPase subunit